MSKKIIIVLIIWVFLDSLSFSAYADDSTHGGGDLLPEYIKPEIEGYVCDTLELDGCISKLDGDNITDSIQGYGKVYINTCPDNRGYIWVSVIKQLGGIRIIYATDDSIEILDKGMYYSYVQAFGNPPAITKPEFTLENENWTASPLCSPSDIPIVIWWGNDEVKYDYDIHVDSTLPVYCNSFETMDDYNAWYSSGYYKLKEYPDQDYSKFGFTPDGNLNDGNVYDLEVPLELKCQGFDNKTIVSTLKDDKVLTWKQSDGIDVKDWYTEIYLRQVGTYKRYIWSAKETFDSGYTKNWNLYGTVLNAKRRYVFEFDDIKDYPCTPNGEDVGGISEITDYYVKMRNSYYDEANSITHYSNWITWHIDSEGNIECVENKDHDVTNTDDDDVDIDSNNYNPGDDYSEKNKDTTSDSLTLDSFLSYLRQAVDTIGNIPTMLGTVFSWLPPIFIAIIVSGIGLLILLRILGR